MVDTAKKTPVRKSAAKPAAVKTVAKPAAKKTAPAAKAAGLSVPVLDIKGKELRTVALPSELFGVKPNEKLLAQYVHVYLTNQHQGTASTKTRGKITMSTRKIYRQKGTGRARHGAASANLFVGGGVTFGPLPRTISAKFNKKQKKQALCSALSAVAAAKTVAALDASSFALKAPSTTTLAAFLKTQTAKKNIVVVLPKVEKNSLVLSLRNIPGVTITDAQSLNAYELLRARRVLFIEDALAVLDAHVNKKEANKSS